MRNYYFVLSYNMSEPRVHKLLDATGLSQISDSLIQLKARSKLYHTIEAAVDGAHNDFSLKLEAMYDEEENPAFTTITAINPKQLDPKIQTRVTTEFGEDGRWDDNCHASIFFCEVAPDSPLDDMEDEELQQLTEEEISAIDKPTTWQLKYEIYFTDDAIEVTSNGEYAFTGPMVQTSSYH
jgi:hypothetical protein